MDTFACALKSEAAIIDYYAKKGLLASELTYSMNDLNDVVELKQMYQDSTIMNHSMLIQKLTQENATCGEALMDATKLIVRFETIYDVQEEQKQEIQDKLDETLLKLQKVKGTRNVLYVVLGAIISTIGIIAF